MLVDTFDRYPRVGIVATKMLLFDQRDHFHYTAGDYWRPGPGQSRRGNWIRGSDVRSWYSVPVVAKLIGGRALEEIGFG